MTVDDFIENHRPLASWRSRPGRRFVLSVVPGAWLAGEVSYRKLGRYRVVAYRGPTTRTASG